MDLDVELKTVSPCSPTNKPTTQPQKKFAKSDIRSFGKNGVRTKVKSRNDEILSRVESLKKSCTNLLPNLNDRVKAGFLIDELECNEAINVKNPSNCQKVRQKTGLDNVCFIGHDVKSLFPSLKSVESARLVRHGVLSSEVDVENFDHKMALRYIYIVGGRELINKAGLSRLCPTWLGSREDLITVGGRKSKSPKSWRDVERTLFHSEKEKILAMLMEIMVHVIMNTHVYFFGGKFFIQKDSGPIGLRSTACLAALIMKLWDRAWLSLAKKHGLSILCFFRYVDYCRNMLHALCEGWRWSGAQFEFKTKWEAQDLASGMSDTHRTMLEVTMAMSSLISFIQFEGEEPGMFAGEKLPTLDTSIWWDGSRLVYEFFEKPTVPNRVFQRDTALAETSIRSSLNQEVFRRLINCSSELSLDRKQEFLSKF